MLWALGWLQLLSDLSTPFRVLSRLPEGRAPLLRDDDVTPQPPARPSLSGWLCLWPDPTRPRTPIPALAMAGAEVLMLLLLLHPGLLTLATGAGGDPFAQQLGPTSSCQLQCQLWNPHAGAAVQEELWNACARGCRLFAICRFVAASSEANVTLAECRAACLQAYDQALEQLACTEGCLRQMPDSQRPLFPPLPSPSPSPPPGHYKRPVPPPDTISVMDVLSNLCNKLISSAQSFISSTWTYYLQADNGKMVVFQSQPEMEAPMPETIQKHAEVTSPVDLHSGPKEKKVKTKGKVTQETSTGPQPEHDFLGCMSKRSGLPKWILASCLLFSVLVMLWLSCASLVTAPDQHIKNQPLSISGDKNYLDGLEWPLAPAPAPMVAVAVEPQEAGSLPLKVEMDRTAL
ncbi:transmembrane protein 59-like [Dromiciops gliroides]|uniref:transmembrane protein 59-like n=1 Tax=Dromiciops gliroides TaxID=33562 RepID=UPI001CC59EE5|nr:transmembrane protein 59-like [Dromiciops gliroides]